MTNEMKEKITTKEAASLLDVKPQTILKYVNEGKLKPVYETNWQIDATKLFYKEDIEKLKQEFIKPGITTGEAAELLRLHTATISQLIQKGQLKAEKKPYKGRQIYFIEPAEIERFKSEYEIKRKGEQKEFFDKETGFAWFQSFTDCNGNSNNRILLDESGDPFLFTESGEKISLDRIITEGYSPVKRIPEHDYISSKRGYAKFRFQPSEMFYSIIELFYQYLGPKNMKISINEDKTIHVEIKPIYIKDAINHELIRELEVSINEGTVDKRENEVFINSDIENITIGVPSEMKERIIAFAKKNDKTIEEVVLSILKERFYS